MTDASPVAAWAGSDPLYIALPRRRSGACRSGTIAPALRAALPRGRPGRAGLDHDPSQARGLSRRVRRLRSSSASPPTPMRTEHDCWPMPASCATAPRWMPSSATRRAWLAIDDSGRAALVVRGREAGREPMAVDGRDPRRDRRVGRRCRAGCARSGFRFVGPTICYAFMQSAGLVNDHVRRLLPPCRSS